LINSSSDIPARLRFWIRERQDTTVVEDVKFKLPVLVR